MAKRHQRPVDQTEEEKIVISIEIPEVSEEASTEVTALAEGETALAVVDLPEAKIAEIEAQYSNFEINGDEQKFLEAKTALKSLVSLRNTLDKRRIAVNRVFTEYVNTKIKGFISRLSVPENHLKTITEAHENAVRLAAEARLKHVKESLINAGYVFDGVSYVCGEHRIFEISLEDMKDQELAGCVSYATDYRLNEATAAAEKARLDAPVYLHQPDINETLIITRREYEEQKTGLEENGVLEITQEKYEEIKNAQLAAFRRPAPAAATPPPPIETEMHGSVFTMHGHTMVDDDEPHNFGGDPIPAEQDPRNNAPEHSPGFMETPNVPAGALKANDSFLPQKQAPANQEPHTGPFAPNFNKGEQAPQEPKKDTLDLHEAGFDAGYECYRKQVLKAFRDPAMIKKRDEWIGWFETLTPFNFKA